MQSLDQLVTQGAKIVLDLNYMHSSGKSSVPLRLTQTKRKQWVRGETAWENTTWALFMECDELKGMTMMMYII